MVSTWMYKWVHIPMAIGEGSVTKRNQKTDIKKVAEANVPVLWNCHRLLFYKQKPRQFQNHGIDREAEFSCYNSKMADTKLETGAEAHCQTCSINSHSLEK